MIKVNNYVEIKYSLFPNNEIKIAPLSVNCDNDIKIELFYDNSIDIMNLIFLKKYIDEKYPTNTQVNLYMYYIPYERMDRETYNQMFTCKYFAQLINSLNFSKIFVLDPHSNVSVGALERIIQLDLTYYVRQVIDDEREKANNIDAIFMPDVGAYKKYSEVLSAIDLPKFWGNKHRDLDDGRITDYDIIGDYIVKDKNILIVDDLCVKGYTTLFAAKKLKELGAKSVIFYCSHCEDNIHAGDLLKTDYVDHIYTTNSLRHDQHSKITDITL
jgi:ribose-phosphate pyrophosphokinase